MDIYVSAKAPRGGDGTRAKPFKTINQAAAIAEAGDTVVVGPGVYREWVDPQNGGTSDGCRVRYISEEPLGAVITGAEPVKCWEPYEGEVWTARIPNGLFGGYNPYTTLVSGDWFIAFMTAHTGDVYLNGRSMYEVTELEKVKSPEISAASWAPEFSVYTWCTEQDAEKDETLLYANFHGLKTNLYELLPKLDTPMVSTELLGEAFEPEQRFEGPDGEAIVFDSDYFGEHRGIRPVPGPFESAGAVLKL